MLELGDVNADTEQHDHPGGTCRASAPESVTITGMAKKPATPADELARMLWQAEARAADSLMQQMLDRLARQTFVGGKRVEIQKLPRVPKRAATTVHRVKVSLYGARPPFLQFREPGVRLSVRDPAFSRTRFWHRSGWPDGTRDPGTGSSDSS
jgi:hypothetical protein